VDYQLPESFFEFLSLWGARASWSLLKRSIIDGAAGFVAEVWDPRGIVTVPRSELKPLAERK